MGSPDFGADPEEEPYRVLGIDPTAGPKAYTPKDQVEQRARTLIKNNKDNKQKYMALQRALKKVKEIHPRQSSGGSWRVPLDITVANSTIEYQTEVTIEVTDFLGNPVPEVNLRLGKKDGQRLGRTAPDGTDDITFSKGTGDFAVIATKGPEKNKVYIDDNLTINVKPRQNRLRFDQVPGTCTAGDDVDVRVVNGDDDAERGVKVTPDTGSPDNTDSDGRASPKVDGSGQITLTATKSTPFDEYNDATASLSVKKRRVALVFDTAPDASKVGKRATFRVVNGDGKPVANAEVTLAGSTITSNSGRVSLDIPPKAAGEATVTASKQDTPGIAYEDATTTVQIDERTVNLSFVDPPDTVTVTDDIDFRVVDEDDDPVSGVTVDGGSASDQTGTRGGVSLSFGPSDLGQISVTASKQGQPGIDYDAARTQIAVEKQEIPLQLSVRTANPTINEPVEFHVSSDNSPVTNATVTHRQLSDASDGSGSASLVFDSGGSKTVVAKKDETAITVFRSDRVDIDIDRKLVQLTLVPPDEKVESGIPATFRVENDEGTGVSEAEVDGADADPEDTNRRGQADLVFRSSGDKRVTASKPPTEQYRYRSDSVTIPVRTPPKTVRITDIPDQVTVGDAAEFKVVDHSGNPISDATIKAVSNQETQIERTNGAGKARFTFQESGFYTVSVTKEGFDVYDQTTLRVAG